MEDGKWSECEEAEEDEEEADLVVVRRIGDRKVGVDNSGFFHLCGAMVSPGMQ